MIGGPAPPPPGRSSAPAPVDCPSCCSHVSDSLMSARLCCLSVPPPRPPRPPGPAPAASGGSSLLNLDFFGPVEESASSSSASMPGQHLLLLLSSNLHQTSALTLFFSLGGVEAVVAAGGRRGRCFSTRKELLLSSWTGDSCLRCSGFSSKKLA